MPDEPIVIDDRDDELPLTNGLIDRDMPCIRCTYNLRGLKPEGQCPECGTEIDKTVAFLMQRVLCNVCLAPNHPMASVCFNCNTPISGAASTADYFRPHAMTARTLREYPDDEPEEPHAPSLGIVVCSWALGCFLSVALVTRIGEVWSGDANPLLTPKLLLEEHIVGTIFFLLLMIIPLCLFYFPLTRYLHLRRQYSADYAAYTAKMHAIEVNENAQGTEEWRTSEEGNVN